MNLLSIDESTVMIDPIQTELKKQLTDEGFKCVSVPLKHSRTLGGGHHCVTCDLERE
jgi:N-dimethylarginine dimethylaminohydrolase